VLETLATRRRRDRRQEIEMPVEQGRQRRNARPVAAGHAGAAAPSPNQGHEARADSSHGRFVRYWEHRDRTDRNELVLEHRRLAEYCAKRFAHRGEPVDDLFQVAQVGLLKAVERFNPHYGVDFASFAVPTMLGELKRHFRDATWPLRVPRRASDLLTALASAAESLSQELRRSPTIAELARRLQVTEDDLLTALEIRDLYRADNLDDTDTFDRGTAPRRSPSVEDSGLDANRLTVLMAVGALSPEDQRVVHFRFYEGLTQAEVGRRVGTGQVQVSRALRRICRELGDNLEPGGGGFTGDGDGLPAAEAATG
jgi:RNA polymerase sigma-B factor